jgi:hypothetical protein
VGLKPTKPFSAEGMRIDPPVSVPIAPAAMPSVTETAAPDDDPPGMRPAARSKAFFGVPMTTQKHITSSRKTPAAPLPLNLHGTDPAKRVALATASTTPKIEPRSNPHSPAAPFPLPPPRFRALALFGRRPSQRVDRPSSRRPKTLYEVSRQELLRWSRALLPYFLSKEGCLQAKFLHSGRDGPFAWPR